MNTLESIKYWFVQAVPEPTDKNRVVQCGVHTEEFGEWLLSIGFKEEYEVIRAIEYISDLYKRGLNEADIQSYANDDVDRIGLADSLADQIVTAIGVAHMFGIDIVGALNEVNRSNYSKFVDGKPVFDSNGKIMKPENYSPPDLTKFV